VSNVEIVGIVVIGLSALLGLIIQLINITSKLTQPFKELTEAIHSLKIVVERLIVGQERIDNELQYLDGRLTEVEKNTHDIKLNCAKNIGYHKKGTE